MKIEVTTPETATAPVNPEPMQAKPATKKQPTKKKAAPKPKTMKAKPAPKAKKPVKTAKPEIKLRPDGLREGSAGGLLVDTVCRKQDRVHTSRFVRRHNNSRSLLRTYYEL